MESYDLIELRPLLPAAGLGDLRHYLLPLVPPPALFLFRGHISCMRGDQLGITSPRFLYLGECRADLVPLLIGGQSSFTANA